MEEMNFNEKFAMRTKKLALQIIGLSSFYKKSLGADILFRQLLRSVTSVAANFRAACRARSGKERYAKLSIVVEEIDETVFWLELAEESWVIAVDESLITVKKEAMEILKVMSAYRKKLKSII
jgi:four helix bundle protein